MKHDKVRTEIERRLQLIDQGLPVRDVDPRTVNKRNPWQELTREGWIHYFFPCVCPCGRLIRIQVKYSKRKLWARPQSISKASVLKKKAHKPDDLIRKNLVKGDLTKKTLEDLLQEYEFEPVKP